MVDCPICFSQHEAMTMHGMEYVPCPRVPPNTLVPISMADVRTTNTINVSRETIESIKRTLYNAIDKLERMATE
jgi:hypothetical protein